MASSTQSSALMAALNKLTNDVYQEKQASAGLIKKAGPTPADPGGYEGASSHATTSVDNNAQAPNEGERSAENTRDVKEAEGASSVENTTAADPQATKQDDVQYNQGLKQSLTGEDPASEDDYKGDKDDPGTSHPANVEDGVKYGSFKEAADHSLRLAHEILADIVTTTAAQNKQAAAPAQPAPSAAAAMNAGYALAADLSKEAGDSHVEDLLGQVFRDAVLNGELVGNYLKHAAVETEEATASSGESEGEESEEKHEAAEGGGGESAASGAGPEPVVEGAAPADPAAALGGGPAMGGGGEEAALQELVGALQELGITPDVLMQAAQEASDGGGEGGMPGAPPMGADPLAGALGGGGAPPMGGDPAAALGGGLPPDLAKAAASRQAAARLQKIASAAQAYQLSGRYEIKAASNQAARATRNHYKAHIRELLGVLS